MLSGLTECFAMNTQDKLINDLTLNHFLQQNMITEVQFFISLRYAERKNIPTQRNRLPQIHTHTPAQVKCWSYLPVLCVLDLLFQIP